MHGADTPESPLNSTLLTSTIKSTPGSTKYILPPHEVKVHLVEVYFEAVQPHFPMLHRPTFLKRLYSGSLLAERYGLVLVYTICALATRYTDDSRAYAFDQTLLYEHSATGQCEPGLAPNPRLSQQVKRSERGKGFIRYASKLLQNDIDKYERLDLEPAPDTEPMFPLIQAVIMLSYAELVSGKINRAHSLLSTCVRMAYDLGLDQVDGIGIKQPDRAHFRDNERSLRLEELRRGWWCLWELESFVCAIRCLPRMIDTTMCYTKLPIDDVDWFEDKIIPSVFLPGSHDQWLQQWCAEQCTSLLANRIISLHFVLALVELASHGETMSNSHIHVHSKIEQSATIWSKGLPAKFKLESRQVHAPNDVALLSNLFPMYIFSEDLSPATIADDCTRYLDGLSSWEGRSSTGPKTTESCTFSDAIMASNNICTIVSDWPSDFIQRSSPLVVCTLWAPAAIQLLIKAFSTSNWELREKASLSLQILTSAMQRFAEYSGLAEAILASFRRYQKKLSSTECLNSDDNERGFPFGKRVLSLPSYVDDAIARSAESSRFFRDMGATGLEGLGFEDEMNVVGTVNNEWAPELASSASLSLHSAQKTYLPQDYHDWINDLFPLQRNTPGTL
ncbi:fungal-specific transcription factor domain-containing protein [Leptodontidium sp. 2 PMI_412]|nr:fungal-specific transcription factor domain-containing protein [Leptodontidium sp. 2 PMI_412]